MDARKRQGRAEQKLRLFERTQDRRIPVAGSEVNRCRRRSPAIALLIGPALGTMIPCPQRAGPPRADKLPNQQARLTCATSETLPTASPSLTRFNGCIGCSDLDLEEWPGSATDREGEHGPGSLEPCPGNREVKPREVVDLVEGHLAVMVAIVDEEPVVPKSHGHVRMVGAMMLLDVLNLENAASELGPIEELSVGQLVCRTSPCSTCSCGTVTP